MFDLIVILVLAALAFPVIAVVALVRVVGLRTHVLRLDSRVRALEAGLVPREAVSPQAPATFAAAPPPVTAPVEAPLPPPLPPLPPPPSVPQTPVLATPPLPSAIGFEERFGTRWVVGRRHCPRARWHISRALHDPARPHRSGCPSQTGCTALLGSGQCRRMGAPQRKTGGTSRPAHGGYSEHPDGFRHHGGVCDGVRSLRAL